MVGPCCYEPLWGSAKAGSFGPRFFSSFAAALSSSESWRSLSLSNLSKTLWKRFSRSSPEGCASVEVAQIRVSKTHMPSNISATGVKYIPESEAARAPLETGSPLLSHKARGIRTNSKDLLFKKVGST